MASATDDGNGPAPAKGKDGKNTLRSGHAHPRFKPETGRWVDAGDGAEFSLDHELFDEEREALEQLVERLPGIVEEEVGKLEHVDAASILREPCAHPHDATGFSGRSGTCLTRHVFTDRFLVNCLLTRKLDVDRTEELLRNNLRYRFARFGRHRAEGVRDVVVDEKHLHGITLGGLPILDDVNPQLLGKGLFWAVPGARAKGGEAVFYGSIENYDPSTMDAEEAVDWLMFMILTSCEMERLDAQRHGFIMIYDMENMGWKHFDQTLEKTMAEVYQDTFPMRWARFAMLKPGMILRAMMQIMRLFIKKKLMNRMKVCKSKEDVFNFVDRENVPQAFGGDLEYTESDYLRDLRAWEVSSSPYYRARMEHEQAEAVHAAEDDEAEGVPVMSKVD
jgi:CRAL/TRIO domain